MKYVKVIFFILLFNFCTDKKVSNNENKPIENITYLSPELNMLIQEKIDNDEFDSKFIQLNFLKGLDRTTIYIPNKELIECEFIQGYQKIHNKEVFFVYDPKFNYDSLFKVSQKVDFCKYQLKYSWNPQNYYYNNTYIFKNNKIYKDTVGISLPGRLYNEEVEIIIE